ncbi:hypothetical protein BDN70DRAFT_274940 [Pholiota conissans]|uniref:F-box domain-containing protein n=1 Tax=Pholiota conissans TaxID=109636 RepID=A0A9P5YSM0_9AGAR|nr:hypothetical protein BDN70DRAFT_274940 [Pholiota conissans]
MSASSRIRTCLNSDTHIICTRVLPDICGPCQKPLYLENHPWETISLFEKRQKLRELANYNHDRFIHCLPLEIASNIFELCMPDSRNLMDLGISHPDVTTIPFRLILSAVCRRWMAIAHSTPRLWTTLLLCTDPLSWPDPILVQTWLNRAGNLALSIRLCISNDLAYASWDAIDAMIDALNQYAGRWLQPKYEGPHNFLQRFIYEEQGKPQMRRLHIDISHPIFYTDLMTALKLRPKRLDALSISELKVTALNIDWQHLTDLEIGSALSTDCFYVLSNAPLSHPVLFTGRA